MRTNVLTNSMQYPWWAFRKLTRKSPNFQHLFNYLNILENNRELLKTLCDILWNFVQRFKKINTAIYIKKSTCLLSTVINHHVMCTYLYLYILYKLYLYTCTYLCVHIYTCMHNNEGYNIHIMLAQNRNIYKLE